MHNVRNIMYIVSLSSFTAGYACAISDCIKKYFYNKMNYPTHFFDYLEISFLSINQLLSLNDTDIDFLHINEDKNLIIKRESDTTVSFNNFDKMISHHDLKNNFNFFEYEKFLDKYIRRYKRLIDLIKKENKIFFIRHGNELIESVQFFFQKIQLKNKNLLFYFIHIGRKEDKIDFFVNDKRYIFVDIESLIEPYKKYNDDCYFKMLELNWKVIYNIIQKRCTIEENNSLNYYG